MRRRLVLVGVQRGIQVPQRLRIRHPQRFRGPIGQQPVTLRAQMHGVVGPQLELADLGMRFEVEAEEVTPRRLSRSSGRSSWKSNGSKRHGGLKPSDPKEEA